MRAQPAEPAITSFDSLYRALFEHARDGVLIARPDGTVLRANSAACRAFGRTEEEIRRGGRAALCVDDGALRTFVADRERTGCATGIVNVRHADGTIFQADAASSVIRVEGGERFTYIVFKDVTARRRSDDALRESEERFRLLADAMPQIVCVLGPDGTPEYVNPTWTALSGLDLAATARAGWDGFIHPDDLAAARDCRARVLGTLAPQDVELRYRGADGSYRWFLSRLAPVVERGRVVRLVGAGMDIDGRRRAEETLRAIYEHAPMAVWLTSLADARIVSVNDAWTKMFGIGREAAVGRTSAELGLVANAERYAQLYAEMRAGGGVRTWETFFRTPSGEERWFLAVATRVSVGGERLLLVTAQDITDRKRMEQGLRDSEQRLAAMFRRSPLANAWTRLPDGTIADVNDAWVKLTGIPREEALGKTSEDLGIMGAEDRTRIYAGIAEAGIVQREVKLLTRANGARDVLVTGERVSIGPEGFLLAAMQDVTDRNRAEEALRAADRRKDEFLGMLSHELRNPLAPIRNALFILDRADPGSEQAVRAREVANRQVAHITRLVDDLLDVTRIARGKIELRRSDVDLAALVWRTTEDHRALMHERGLELRAELPRTRVPVNGDETRLAQVLGNLLSNAAKFTPAGGRVTVALATSGGRAVVSVTDTGAGIPAGLLASIFEPFTQAKQTLARSEGGLGLGLALVKGLVALHGGDVSARSAGEGQGAEFVVWLPLALRGAAVEGHGRAAARAATIRRRVLVVDDNRDAAETMAQLLQMFGHEAVLAFDGPSALALARERAPDVVLCDIGLPLMDGFEVARRLREAYGARLRLVAVSGYAQADDVARAAEAGFDAHLAKPMDPGDLERIVEG